MRTRDALEPLLAGLGLIAAERDGKVAVLADQPAALELTLDALALPDEGGRLRAERTLEPTPGEARVRFIDGDADYQTGSVVARSAGEGGGVDLDLPAVCSVSLARTAAERALESGLAERLTAALGPLEALRLEPGDGVTVEGWTGAWRVARLDLDEAPSAVLERMSSITPGEDDSLPKAGEAAAVPGAPLFRMIELPPLPGAETDGRPLAVVAAEPWRSMSVFAGADALSMTLRGVAAQPSTVGVLVEPLSGGTRHRWDEARSVVVRVEGRAPESRGRRAVLGGANAVAIATEQGWELAQFRTAELIGDDVWRLSGLLRGQQGTEVAMRAGAAAGALVVLLDATPARAECSGAERGLPLLWRAGPAGGPPGGAGVSETTFTLTGVHERPWSPAHLRAALRSDGGFDLGWISRLRLDGDRWDGEPAASSPRFRVRVLDGPTEVRAQEVEETGAIYPADAVTADFPLGPGPDAVVAVAQWGDGYGWGVEARASLIG